MIKEAIGTGSTVEEAKEAALRALEAPEDADIKYEVLEREKKALFGLFGGSQAKVKASYEFEDDPFAKAKDYVQTILKKLGVNDAEISVDGQLAVAGDGQAGVLAGQAVAAGGGDGAVVLNHDGVGGNVGITGQVQIKRWTGRRPSCTGGQRWS